MELQEFIKSHLGDNLQELALQRNRYPELTDADFSFVIRQIEGIQRTKDKLPFVQYMPNWWFAKRLSTEQCSSEDTARYKAQIIDSGDILTDLTGGMGIDLWFLSDNFKEVHYVERDEELCMLARHNFDTYSKKQILVHCADAAEYLKTITWSDTIFIDPARRNVSGGKVYRLEDCEPNILLLFDKIQTSCSVLLIKLSPMLDLTAAIKNIPCVSEVHIVSVRNEVKELLVKCVFNKNRTDTDKAIIFHAVAIDKISKINRFSFCLQDEQNAQCMYATEIMTYLFEPDVAILKAGAFKLISQRYGLYKLAYNTHLYTANFLPSEFIGRVWRVKGIIDKHSLKGMHLNILSRNYPLTVDFLRKKYSIKEGKSNWLIATKLSNDYILVLAERLV